MHREIVLLCLVITVVVAGNSPFAGHKVIRVVPKSDEQLKTLVTLLKDAKHLDIWRYPSRANAPVDILLSPFDYNDVTSALNDHGIETFDLISDVQRLINRQRRTSLKFKPKFAEFDYGKYHTFEEINDWMDNKTTVYKDIVSKFTVANSYENRPMNGIKISTPSVFNKPAFFIEGGIHAREWISPATVVYMTGQMLDSYKKDPALTEVIDKFDWYILPVTNPDGYVYTFKDAQTRLWRKTRSKHGICIGVDPNRNWDEEWCKEGASKEPCSDTYCGPSAFSEVEVKGVADFIQGLSNVSAFIDFHSYSQMWMSPWGYTRKLPEDFPDQDGGSKAAVDALEKVNGKKFVHGSIANVVYVASGSSADWVYGKAGVKYSYGVELRDTGEHGFLLPPDQIIPSGEETLAAVAALANYIADKK